MEEESIFDRPESLIAKVNQMKVTVEKNIQNSEGDNIEDREFLKSYLEAEITKKTKEIENLKTKIRISQK